MKVSLTLLLLFVGSACSYEDLRDQVQGGHRMYRFGLDVGDKTTPKEDDGVTTLELTQPMKFYGETYKQLYISYNGMNCLSKPYAYYDPQAIPLDEGIACVAGWWADMDIRIGGDIYYQYITDPELLSKISDDINKKINSSTPFNATAAAIITYFKVAYYETESNKTNTIQVIFVYNANVTYVVFWFIETPWIAAPTSGGDPQTGLGENGAQVCLDRGNREDYFCLPGSYNPGVKNITNTTNVNESGLWIIQAAPEFKSFLSEDELEVLEEEDEERQAKDNRREAEERAAREAEEAASKAEEPVEPESELDEKPEAEEHPESGEQKEQEEEKEEKEEEAEEDDEEEEEVDEDEDEDEEDEADCEERSQYEAFLATLAKYKKQYQRLPSRTQNVFNFMINSGAPPNLEDPATSENLHLEKSSS